MTPLLERIEVYGWKGTHVIDVRLPDERMVLDAARLKADHPMAYADAFGAALAISEAATLWTGDPELLVEGSRWDWLDLRASD